MKKFLLWIEKTLKIKNIFIFLYHKKATQSPLPPLTQLGHWNELLSLHGKWLLLTPDH